MHILYANLFWVTFCSTSPSSFPSEEALEGTQDILNLHVVNNGQWVKWTVGHKGRLTLEHVYILECLWNGLTLTLCWWWALINFYVHGVETPSWRNHARWSTVLPADSPYCWLVLRGHPCLLERSLTHVTQTCPLHAGQSGAVHSSNKRKLAVRVIT